MNGVKMSKAMIAGMGMYAPEKVVENEYFSKTYGRDMDTFLREHRNISQRRFMSAEQATSDLAVKAAEEALSNAGISATDLDLIIVATDTPDFISPSTTSVVHFKLSQAVAQKLGKTNFNLRAGTFDVNSACCGFVTALDVASKYITADERFQNILVIGAYGMSKYFDWSDFKVTSVFADGAGAAVVRRVDQNDAFYMSDSGLPLPLGILTSFLTTESFYHDHLGIFAGGTKNPISETSLAERQHLLQFPKRIPPEKNSQDWPVLVNALLDRINAVPDDVDHYFFTQININSVMEAMATLKVSSTKAHNIMDRFGYTGSACLPMALADAAEAHKLRKGDLVVLIGSGGGLSMGGLVMRWNYDT